MNDLTFKIKRLLLVIGDILFVYIALALTLIVRYGFSKFNLELWIQHFWPFTAVFVLWFLIFYINGLYDLRITKDNVSLFIRLLGSLVIGAGISFTYFYLLTNRFFTIKPQTVLVLDLIIFGLLFYSWRNIYNSFILTRPFKKNVLVIGFPDGIMDVVNETSANPQLGYEIKVIISNRKVSLPKNSKIKIIREIDNFKKIISKNRIDIVVSSLDYRNDKKIIEHLYESLYLKIKFVDFPNFYEEITKKIPIGSIEQVWFLENIEESDKKTFDTAKRMLDILFSAIAGIISIPIIPLIILAVKISSRGPIFFIQPRIGKDGNIFYAIKFRSMIVSAEKKGPQWTRINDPRITSVGKFIRKTRLDEIPQLWNILKGEMSFVGPRPEQPKFVEELLKKIPFYRERLLVKPGLTGWAQINFPQGASEEDTPEKLQFDLYYIKNRSYILDLGIILKTINIVFSGKGR